MKILVLNGSPSGKASITLQTMEYIEALYPQHEYEVLHVGQQIRRFEKDFSEARAALESAELIVFCYPVYTFLAPAQLHRFIELMKESGIDFSSKYATQLTTSKHFYDTTAHRYIADNCADLKLRCIRGLSADMEDLLTKKGQKEARSFFRYVLWNIRKGYCEPASVNAALGADAAMSAKPAGQFGPVCASDVPADNEEKNRSPQSRNMHIALVADYDAAAEESALATMIRRFCKKFPGECEIVNLREFPFAGGCLGCFHCASDGKCIYKDGFDSFLREHINNADAVVYAFTIKDHSMGYRFKLYDDRQFCNGHRTVTMGKPVGYLVDGNLMAEDNLRTLIEARAEVGGNFLTGIASDMTGSASDMTGNASDEKSTDREIDQLAQRLAYAIRHNYAPPKNFYGVGGLKIFRDLIYEMQGMMKEDHRFYKEHGFYDFPQRKRVKIAAMYLVGALMNNPKLLKKSKISMTDGMLMPYKKVIEDVKAQINSPCIDHR